MNNAGLKTKFYDPKIRGVVFQITALFGTIFFLYWISQNIATNLERQGIASGFSFLSNTAGFDITMSMLPFSEESTYGMALWVAIANTLLVSFIGIILATLLGFIIGIARLSPNWLLARIAEVYIETIRNIPLLLQLFFWYFAVLRTLPSPRNSFGIYESFFLNIRGLYLPKPVTHDGFIWVISVFCVGIASSLLLRSWARKEKIKTGLKTPTFKWIVLLTLGFPGFTFLVAKQPLSLDLPVLQGFNFHGGIVLIPEFVALLLALTLYTASFIAEIVRAGIQSVDKGQTEAAMSLGLSRSKTLQFVIIPQALRVIIPPLTSQFLNLTKNSSLAAAIAYPDLVLVFAGTVLMQTGQAVEVIMITMTVYAVISLAISFGMNKLNRKFAIVGRG